MGSSDAEGGHCFQTGRNSSSNTKLLFLLNLYMCYMDVVEEL